MSTIDFFRKNEWEILNKYGHTITGNRHIDCPICQSKKKFRLSDYQGRASWICVCGNGDAVKLILETTGMQYKDLMREVEKDYDLKNDFKPIKKAPVIEIPTPTQIKGSEAETYLNGRGINMLPRKHIHYAPNQFHMETNSKYGAMFAQATDYKFDVAQIHRTFLTNGHKVDQTAKKMQKVIESQNIAVRMFDTDSCIGIGEGIESSLSAAQLYSVPVWAALNTAFLKKFRAPLGVKTLNIYADNDCHGAGLAAAFVCGNSNLMCKNDVKEVWVKWAERGDFNDHLNDPKKIFEWKLNR